MTKLQSGGHSHNMKTKEYSINVGGKNIKATFSDLVDQANGSVILTCEDTTVLATVVMSKEVGETKGFFNLTVDYLEKFYATGLILGGQYNKRESKPSDEAILTSRIIDRTIRPLFPKHIKNAVQVIVTVLSVGKADPGVLGINAASLAIAVSDIPWDGPVGAVHIGKLKNQNEIKYDDYFAHNGESAYELDLTICGRNKKILMIESMASQLSVEEIGNAFDIAESYIKTLEDWQKEIVKTEGKEKQNIPKPTIPEDITAKFHEIFENNLYNEIFSSESKKNLAENELKWEKIIKEMYPPSSDYETDKTNKEIRMMALDYFHHQIDRIVHEGAVKENKRVDGRSFTQIRQLYAKAGGISPIIHGTGIFYRGETHVFSALTLGGPKDVYVLDGMEVRGNKRFMHHYNFPPYSSGETGRVGGINRREMGHGMLAEKALTPVIPPKEKFPYTIRIVSESMASNGSTSQASICASTLALMDGGVPILAPVAGIAIGAMIDENNEDNYKILTDIQGLEDHHGDMDFKVAGTSNGITAIQLDIKTTGISSKLLKEALVQSRNAHAEILEVIKKEISEPRKELSPNAPKILMIKIDPEKIGLIIGGGGKTINGIKDKTGAEINIEDDGTIYIIGKGESVELAQKEIESLTHEYKIGEIVEVEIEKIMEFGAFAKIDTHTDGLIHISEISHDRVDDAGKYLKVGQRVTVQIVKIENGKIGLSIKALLPKTILKSIKKE